MFSFKTKPKNLSQMLEKKLLNTLSLLKNSLWEFSNFAEFTQTVENQNCGIEQNMELKSQWNFHSNAEYQKTEKIKKKRNYKNGKK